MLFVPKQSDGLAALAHKLQVSAAPTSALVAEIVANGCSRLGDASRFDRLVKAHAWTDCALALIAAELPGWALRRLAFDDGAWFCSLSNHPEMPLDLDDTADGSHVNLPLALLIALIEAKRRVAARGPRVVHHDACAPGLAICCDNFA